MKKTNLNIKRGENILNYVVEYIPDTHVGGSFGYYDAPSSLYRDIYMIDTDGKNMLKRTENNWESFDPGSVELTYTNMPYKYDTATVRVYFPEFSVESFGEPVDYAFDVYMNIHGRRIILGSYLLNRRDALACERPMHYMNNIYYECIDIPIVDPRDILYGDNWVPFRKFVCYKDNPLQILTWQDMRKWREGQFWATADDEDDTVTEQIDPNTYTGGGILMTNWRNNDTWNSANIWDSSHVRIYEANNDAGSLYFAIHPVDDIDGMYVKDEYYGGCQGSIVFTENPDYFKLGIGTSLSEANDEFKIRCRIDMNSVYDNIFEYIRETYFINTEQMVLEMVIQDDENIWKYPEPHIILKSEDTTPNSTFWDQWDFDIFEEPEDETSMLYFNSWDEYKPGMYINAKLTIYPHSTDDMDEDESILRLTSNKIPVTPDIFRFMIKDDDTDYIDLTNLNMDTYNINIVNKSVNKTVVTTNVSDNKTKFITPVFFRTQSIANITVHPEVTENICLNLDAYKSKVSSFQLQLGGVMFVESGRTQSGVIFKIVGSKLSGNTLSEGTYYILSENGEVVTNGKYTFEY